MTGILLLSILSTDVKNESDPFPNIESDFSKKPLAPSFPNCVAFFGERPVNIITGIAVVAESFFNVFITSGPLI